MMRRRPTASLAFCFALIAFCLGSTVQSQDPDALRRKLFDAIEDERWDQALEAAKAVVGLDPQDPTSHYNVACVLARKGETDLAVQALRYSVDLGFDDLDLLRNDPDLASLRDQPGYLEVVEKIAERAAKRSAEIRALAARAELSIFPPEAEKARDNGEMPLVVFLHGRGGRADRMAERWRESASKIGAVLVVPQAFEPWGNGFQWGAIDDAIYRVEHAVDYAAARYPIDRERIVVAGFSQGAFVSALTVTRNPENYAGAIIIGACHEQGFGFEADAEPLVDPPPIYIGVGSEDRVYDRCRPMVNFYKDAGFKVKYRVYKGYGHVFPQNYEWEFDRALRFILD